MEPDRDASPDHTTHTYDTHRQCRWCGRVTFDITCTSFISGRNDAVCCCCESLINPTAKTVTCPGCLIKGWWKTPCRTCETYCSCLNLNRTAESPYIGCCECFSKKWYVLKPEEEFPLYCLACRNRTLKRHQTILFYFALGLECDAPILESLYQCQRPIQITDKFVETHQYNHFLRTLQVLHFQSLGHVSVQPLNSAIGTMMTATALTPENIWSQIRVHPTIIRTLDRMLSCYFQAVEDRLPMEHRPSNMGELYWLCKKVRAWFETRGPWANGIDKKFIDWETSIHSDFHPNQTRKMLNFPYE